MILITNNCDSCSSRYYVKSVDDHLECVDCGDNCRQCTLNEENVMCMGCDLGYGKFDIKYDIKLCLPSLENCESCYQDYKVCQKCYDGDMDW